MNKLVKVKKDDRSVEEQIKELRVVIKSVIFAVERTYAVRFDVYPLEKPLSSKIRTLGDWKEKYDNEGSIRNV